tara:strand:- start:608 stop:1372 length:765 start_codon:yes stop_codon:yes gene_type:complete
MSQIKIKQIQGLQSKLDALDTQLASGSLKSSYVQNTHGYSAGDVIAYFGGSWVLADSKTADKLGRLVIESVVDANEFVAVQIGNITVNSWSLVPGSFYVVDDSETGGIKEFVSIEDPKFPFSNPILQAITEKSAQVLPWRPSLGAVAVAQGTEYTQADLIPTPSDGGISSTGITLDYTPFADSTVQVYMNGVAVTESYGDFTGDVFFSADGGTTSKVVADLEAGDTLYWSSDNAGYEIGEGDAFDIVYERNSLD